ncbi:MAG TPA: hypothetical protein PLM98_08715, partial [Thiolinea sp.]|nr:hypothetical protein [Thiolinea sp.]
MKNLLILLGLIIFVGLITFSQSIRYPISFIIETNYLSQPYDQKGFIKGGLFLISYLASLVALSSILFISKPWVAIALIALCSLVFGIDVYAQLLGSNPNGISVEGLSTALSEQGRLKDLLVYRTLLIDSLLASLAFFIFSVLLNRLITKTYRLWYGWSILSLVLVTLGIGLLSHKIFSIKNQSYPAPIKLPLVFNEYLADRPFNQLRTLNPTIRPEHSAEYETIVWIIDESILGSYLSINGYAQDTTPFLKSISLSESMQNYGVVNSISNCSNTSNLLLRIGLTTTLNQDFKTAKNNLPTIFQYAKHAGFETILMDGQIVPGELQNHLNAHDLKFIDQYTAYPRSIYPQQRDRELLKSLVPLLAKPTNKRFIVVIKWGAHWPYPLAYPKEQTFFSPA